MFHIFQSLAELPDETVASHAKKYLLELSTHTVSTTQESSLEYIGSNSWCDPITSTSTLLDRVQNRASIEPKLRGIKHNSLQDRPEGVYIPPMAKTTIHSNESFDLKSKVTEFLESDKKVLLILGNSGAGKSTFNRTIEADLWSNYNPGDRIPLFIYLPSIDRPDDDLISKHLRKFNITEDEIQQLKISRELILICDAYDETQLQTNIYRRNRLNENGGWKVQMIISCRIEYNGKDYIDQF
jgi:predicted NACHT family NTPase